MDAKVTWKGKMTFSGTSDSGFELPLGTYPELGGDNDGFRPMELLAIGLGGCTAMDVISILQKKRQQITDFEVDIKAKRASEHPKVFTQARVTYVITGQAVDESAVVRAIELSVTRYCPATAMFSQVMPIETAYTIYEAGENGERQLVKSGTYNRNPDQD
ncbi:MAG TPA: OsmC family protein [Anaerolineales bacterium]|nr:OsmC family protein [Anaerolineales bacterium]